MNDSAYICFVASARADKSQQSNQIKWSSQRNLPDPTVINDQSGLRADSPQEINKYMSVYFSITGSDPFYFSHIFEKQ